MPQSSLASSPLKSLLPIWGAVTMALLLTLVFEVCRMPALDPHLASAIPTAGRKLPAASSSAGIEVELAATDKARFACVIIGSLGNAGTAYPVRLEFLDAEGEADRKPPDFEVVARNDGYRRADPGRVEPASYAVPSSRSLEVAAPFPRQRSFFLQTGSDPSHDASYRLISTALVCETRGVRIWQETSLSPSTPSESLARLAECVEFDILPQVSRLLGEIADIDEDGTLAICLTSKLAEFPARGTPVHGLVQINDFQSHLPRPFGNHADVMFLSPEILTTDGSRAILAHEAAHLATFSRRRELDAGFPQFDGDWLNEGLAHAAEIECTGDWSNLKSRWRAFQVNTSGAPLEVQDARRQQLWRNAGTRGAAWSFMAWLTDEFGLEVLRRLAEHPATGREKLELVAQEPFAELFRRWSVAVCSRQFSTGRSAAPVMIPLNPTESPCELMVHGTSWLACRQLLPADSTRRLRITAPQECQMQVTLVREGDGRLELQRLR